MRGIYDGYTLMKTNGETTFFAGGNTESGFVGNYGDIANENELERVYIIKGGPGTGKTTLLRDLCRQLASGSIGECKKVAVIDSRGEIAAVNGGVPYADIGVTADIITGADKAKGIEMALRTLFPDVIAFDELGNMAEVEAITQSFNSGVTIITTAHIGGFDDIMRRPLVNALLKTGAIEWVVLCYKGFGFKIKKVDELNLLNRETVSL